MHWILGQVGVVGGKHQYIAVSHQDSKRHGINTAFHGMGGVTVADGCCTQAVNLQNVEFSEATPDAVFGPSLAA